MKPGVIVNVSRNMTESGASNTMPNDWYKEEKWKRISDWIGEIEKETVKNKLEAALVQTNRIQLLLENIKNKEKYREQPLPSYHLAEMENLNKNWNRISSNSMNAKLSLEEENIRIRREIEILDQMKQNYK